MRDRLVDSSEIRRFGVIAARAQPDDQSVPERDNVICSVARLPMPVLGESRRPRHQHYAITGGDDRFELRPHPLVGPLAHGLLQLLAAMTNLRLGILRARIEVSPFQIRVHQLHHPRDVASVVSQEGLGHGDGGGAVPVRNGYGDETEYTRHFSGTPFSSLRPRSSKAIPDPTTRSFTV